MNKELKNRLLELNQDHLIRHYESLSDDEKAEFLNNLTKADFKKLALAFNEKDSAKTKNQIDHQDFTIKENYINEKNYNKGLDLIKNSKAAVLIMSGGMGSRLGFDGPKGAFIIADQKSLFQIHVEKLIELNKKIDFYPYLFIMCSDLNFESTKIFFKEHNYFKYPKNRIEFFIQGNLPACDENYKVLLESKTKIKEVPDGNGGIFDALEKSGLLTKLKNEGVKWLQVAGVDNVLLKILDPYFLAFAEESGLDLASVSVGRINESEKVGVFALKNGRPTVLEYTEIEENLLRLKEENGEYFLSEANIANHFFNIHSKTFEKVSQLPFHKAHKKISYFDGNNIISPKLPNAYKFEQFIFDAFKFYDKMAVLRVKRDEEFSPLKNKDGKDSIETAREAYLKILK